MKCLMRKWRNDFKTIRNNEMWYDLFDDWDLIASSLKTQYKYSIRQEIDKLSWGELCSDIAGLNGDTPLGNVIRIRSEKDPEVIKKFSQAEREIYNKWNNRQITAMSEQDYEQAMKNIEKVFLAIGERR